MSPKPKSPIGTKDGKKKRHLSFNTYLRRVAHQAGGPDMHLQLSDELKTTLVRLNAVLLARMVTGAAHFCRHAKHNKLRPVDLFAAMRAQLPKRFAMFSVGEASKAVSCYTASLAKEAKVRS